MTKNQMSTQEAEQKLAEFIDFYKDNKDLLISSKFSILNLELSHLTLHGLGILNWTSHNVSGETNFLKDYLTHRKKAVVFDIGAHTGGYAGLIKKIKPKAELLCFEPHPDSYAHLKKFAATTQKIKTYNLALSNLSDTKEKKLLYDHAENPGSEHASFYQEVIQEIHASSTAHWPVKTTTLDKFVGKAGIGKIDLFKIDTEGNEKKVLEGAQKTISKGIIECFQIEFNEMNVLSRTFFRDLLVMLKDYRFFRLLVDGYLPLKKYKAIDCEIFAFQNIIALKKNSTFLKHIS